MKTTLMVMVSPSSMKSLVGTAWLAVTHRPTVADPLREAMARNAARPPHRLAGTTRAVAIGACQDWIGVSIACGPLALCVRSARPCPDSLFEAVIRPNLIRRSTQESAPHPRFHNANARSAPCTPPQRQARRD